MRIGFEAKRFFTNFTGLGNYSRFIVSALSTYFPDNEYFLYSPARSRKEEVESIAKRSNIVSVHPSGLVSVPGLSALWRSWMTGRRASKDGIRLFHGLSNELPFGLSDHTRKIVTIHDLIFLRFPRFYNSLDRAIYFSKAKSACDRADSIIAISAQTAEDISSFLAIKPEKIRVVYQGCHPQFNVKVDQQEISAVKSRYGLPSEYILNVGTIEPRKNLAVLVEAMARLPESARMPLVVVGRKTQYLQIVREKILRHGIQSLVHFVHNASFTDFPALYQGARLVVYPSLFEGFGIPLVEAIASGVPVITSRGSCFMEAAGPDAIYVDANNADELAVEIRRVIDDSALRNRMIASSSAFIRRFEPHAIASSLMRVYESVL